MNPTEVLEHVVDALSQLFSQHLARVSSFASAVILIVIVVGMFLLLGYIARLKIKQPDLLPSTDDTDAGADAGVRSSKIRDQLERYREQIRELKTNPEYSTVEKLYFAVNGIVNSGFVLSIALLLWEFFRYRPAAPAALKGVSEELSYLIIALACMMLVSGIIVTLATLNNPNLGRSYQRINHAFAISSIIAVAAFGVFAFAVFHP